MTVDVIGTKIRKESSMMTSVVEPGRHPLLLDQAAIGQLEHRLEVGPVVRG